MACPDPFNYYKHKEKFKLLHLSRNYNETREGNLHLQLRILVTSAAYLNSHFSHIQPVNSVAMTDSYSNVKSLIYFLTLVCLLIL